jgi:hypothetical protein
MLDQAWCWAIYHEHQTDPLLESISREDAAHWIAHLN